MQTLRLEQGEQGEGSSRKASLRVKGNKIVGRTVVLLVARWKPLEGFEQRNEMIFCFV